MSAATACAVLRNSTLRWSSPILFNDPFDVPREMSFGLIPKDIVRAIGREIERLITTPPSDTSYLEEHLRLAIETVRREISAEVKKQMLSSLREGANSFTPSGESLEALRAMWRGLLPNLRILCVTESPAHVAMWYHYADQYKGVAIEFACDDQVDSALLCAKRVAYLAKKPAVYTASGWAKILCMRKDIAIREILRIATYTKSVDWSYEHEWRVVSQKRPSDDGLFTDYCFHPGEVRRVFLGPLISVPDKTEILSLLRSYPKAKAFNVALGMSRELEFNGIDF